MKVFLVMAILALMSSIKANGGERLVHEKRMLKSDMLNFRYEPYENGLSIKCTQVCENEYGLDWHVTCSDDSKFLRDYRVHLLLNRVMRQTAPKASYELLYWVTEFNQPTQTAGNGPSLWFHFNNDAEWHSLSVGQQVENGTAGLYLDIKRPE